MVHKQKNVDAERKILSKIGDEFPCPFCGDTELSFEKKSEEDYVWYSLYCNGEDCPLWLEDHRGNDRGVSFNFLVDKWCKRV